MGYKCNNGFTLIEMVMVMAIIGVIALPGAFLMQYLIRSSVFIPRQLNMEMLAADSLDIMIEGDSRAKGLRFSRNITNIAPNEISFNNQDNQLIRYRLVGNKLYRSISGGPDELIPYYIPASGVTMAGKNGILFTYLDAGENPTATAADVRRVEMALTAVSGSGMASDWEGSSEQVSSSAVKKFQ